MLEWIMGNWRELLGTGGLGIVTVALIGLKGKKDNNSSISQKSRSGKNSTSYQAGGNINYKINSQDQEVESDERKSKN